MLLLQGLPEAGPAAGGACSFRGRVLASASEVGPLGGGGRHARWQGGHLVRGPCCRAPGAALFRQPGSQGKLQDPVSVPGPSSCAVMHSYPSQYQVWRLPQDPAAPLRRVQEVGVVAARQGAGGRGWAEAHEVLSLLVQGWPLPGTLQRPGTARSAVGPASQHCCSDYPDYPVRVVAVCPGQAGRRVLPYWVQSDAVHGPEGHPAHRLPCAQSPVTVSVASQARTDPTPLMPDLLFVLHDLAQTGGGT